MRGWKWPRAYVEVSELFVMIHEQLGQRKCLEQTGFEKFHPLTKTRFELLDGVKEPGKTIPKVQERITADVHSAQLENLTKDQ